MTEIKFDKRNYRKHNDKNKSLIRKSLEECGEIWVDVKGYEGLYKVSNKGRIKSLARGYKNQYGTAYHCNHKMQQAHIIQSIIIIIKGK